MLGCSPAVDVAHTSFLEHASGDARGRRFWANDSGEAASSFQKVFEPACGCRWWASLPPTPSPLNPPRLDFFSLCLPEGVCRDDVLSRGAGVFRERIDVAVHAEVATSRFTLAGSSNVYYKGVERRQSPSETPIVERLHEGGHGIGVTVTVEVLRCRKAGGFEHSRVSNCLRSIDSPRLDQPVDCLIYIVVGEAGRHTARLVSCQVVP